jgi:uncharacterized protein YbbC (DUF1343 family)
MSWPDTTLPWVPPSPALLSFTAALAYPGTCLLEGTTVSEGRGTSAPFEVFGAPFLDGPSLLARLSPLPALDGCRLSPVTFTPATSKWSGAPCSGLRLEVRDPARFRPVRAGLAIVSALQDVPGFAYRPRQFDALAGTSTWRQDLESGRSPEEVAAAWAEDERSYREARDEFLLYN